MLDCLLLLLLYNGRLLHNGKVVVVAEETMYNGRLLYNGKVIPGACTRAAERGGSEVAARL